MALAKLSAKSFIAPLEHMPGNLGWVIIRVPIDVAKVWGKRGQLKVRGEISSAGSKVAGFAFRTSLFPDGKGHHFMMVNKKMQKGARVSAGMKAKFHIEQDIEVRVVLMPKECERMLATSKRLRKFYDSLNYSSRKDIAGWVAEVKQPETRVRRANKMAERLLETMEAERELPPMIRRAMAMEPKAALGWQRMPPLQKRGHLLGIFYYRTPEARARRLQKAIEMMLEYAEKSRF